MRGDGIRDTWEEESIEMVGWIIQGVWWFQVDFQVCGNGDSGIDLGRKRRNRCNSGPAKLEQPVKPTGEV